MKLCIHWYPRSDGESRSASWSHNLIRAEATLCYEFEMDYKTIDATQSICRGEGIGGADYSKAARNFKKFRSDCKNIGHKAKSGWPNVNPDAVLQVIDKSGE